MCLGDILTTFLATLVATCDVRHLGSQALRLTPARVLVPDYSCALVGDILLQGQLYITSNYFAFYSNVFGYVTKVRAIKT